MADMNDILLSGDPKPSVRFARGMPGIFPWYLRISSPVVDSEYYPNQG